MVTIKQAVMPFFFRAYSVLQRMTSSHIHLFGVAS
jgi:hypothetical protein